MFIVFLKFTPNREKAGSFLEAHMKWLKQGFDDGLFLLAGSIKPGLGGSIIAHNTSFSELQKRVEADPFVVEKIVSKEIFEIAPSATDPRLQFLTKG